MEGENMAQTKEIKQGDGSGYPEDKPHILEQSAGEKQQTGRTTKGDRRATESPREDARERSGRGPFRQN